MRKIIYTVIVLYMAMACGQRNSNKNNDAQERDLSKLRFEAPTPPAVMGTNEERLNYMLDHYWDNFDFNDTAYMSVPDVTEQALANYLYILLNAEEEQKVKNSVAKMLASAEINADMYKYFASQFERYLYEEGSPLRNEDLYIIVLENLIESGMLDEYEKIRPKAHLEMALKNRVGDKAYDVVATLANGAKARLYNVKSEFTLLYINNPDCSACAAITADIQNSEQLLMKLINSGRMKVFAVYPDEDLEAWRKNTNKMPSDWINGYDAELDIRNNRTYDIKAIPTLYLLDKDKKVLLKDVADAVTLEYYFAERAMELGI